MITIRHMFEYDMDDVFDVERMSFKIPFGRTLITNLYLGAPELCFVVLDSDEIVGFLLGGYTALPKQSHILSIAIKEDVRGKGYGKKLLRHFIDNCTKFAYTSVKLEVKIDNTRAIQLYEEEGFHIDSKIRKYYEDNTDAYVMIKHI